MLPLLFDDEAGALPEMDDKTCFSYIGTIAADHAFDQFVRFADHGSPAFIGTHLATFPPLHALQSLWIGQCLFFSCGKL